MTPEEMAVVEAAKAWEAKIPADSPINMWADPIDEALIDAVRALTPPEPELPPEPGEGAVVVAHQEFTSEVYQRVDSDEFTAEHRWYMAGQEHPRTWEQVCAGSTVERLRGDRDIAELAELAKDGALLNHHRSEACASDDDKPFATCQTPQCVRNRALLARFASLADTTTPAEETQP